MRYTLLYSLIIAFLGLIGIFPANCQVNKAALVYSSWGIMQNPWAGGMNSCQFGKLDINMDGVDDLMVFDRCGNRIMPFIKGSGGEFPDLTFAPEYIPDFPELSDWVIFADYNGDGKMDIFTYSPGYAGMKVFKNVSSSTLEFKIEVSPYLKSFQGGGYVNILVTYADYPGIYDLDGDGDLDILTFWGLGSFVEMHRNMSVEKYGNLDSLDFVKTSNCWGFFAESEESNVLTLDTCFGMGEIYFGRNVLDENKNRHTGSTFQLLDLDGNNLVDLLLGDVDYPNLVALYNGGNPDTAWILSYDWEYPQGNTAVDLFSMPCAFHEDMNGDELDDLVISPFDPNPFISNNINSSWLYLNYGTAEVPQFELYSKNFLQDEMIDVGSGAYPVFCDYNGDGLLDLFIGNYGSYDSSYYDQFNILHTENTAHLALFRNSGSSHQPSFISISDDFAALGQPGITGFSPTFGDIDGDGDPDLIAGSEEGNLIYYENTAQPGSEMDLTFRDDSFQGIDVGDYSTPCLFDLDDDGLLDLIIGERGGNLNYYHNEGSVDQAIYELVTDSLGKVNVTDYAVSLYGYSVPSLARDMKDNVELLVGSEQGKIFFFPDIQANLTGKFKESEDLGGLIGLPGFDPDRGYRTAATLEDLDNDGTWDLIAGNFSGGLEYFSSGESPEVSGIEQNAIESGDLLLYPNPASDRVTVETSIPGRVAITSITIMDPLGRILGEFDFHSQKKVSIPVSGYQEGFYFLKVRLIDLQGGHTVLLLKKMLKKSK